jgi:histone H3/H4
MKGTTAYFVFTAEQRPSVREAILKQRGEGAKLSVADVAKEIGKRWRELTDADKEAYKGRAQAQAQALKDVPGAGEGAADGEQQHEGEGAHGQDPKEPSPLDSLLPLSMVRRIILADPDVSRVAHEGIVAVAMATNLLLGLLAKHTANHAKSQKRRTIMLKDFVQVSKRRGTVHGWLGCIGPVFLLVGTGPPSATL